MAKAQSTYGTYLLVYDTASSKYKKLIDIIDYSDLGSTPNIIETTTLSDDAETSIFGIKRMGDGLTFTVNITKEAHTLLKSYEDRELHEFALVFANDKYSTLDSGTGVDDTKLGNAFAAYFCGMLTFTVNGGGVDEAVQGTVTIAPQLGTDASGAYIQDEVISFTKPTNHLATA